MASSTEDEHGIGLSLLTVLVLMAFLARAGVAVQEKLSHLHLQPLGCRI